LILVPHAPHGSEDGTLFVKETGLPLIVCPTCKRERVIELIVRTTENGNQGHVFFKCPRNVRGVRVFLDPF